MKVTLGPKNLFFQIIAWCVFGFILSIVFIKFSPLIVLIALIAVLFIFLALKRPEIALLGILIATSSIVFEDQLPLINLGSISLHISDLLLFTSLGLIAIRRLVEHQFKIMRTPLDWPLLIFIGLTLLSTLSGVFNNTVEAVEARRWIRVMAYYLTFFIVTNLVRDRRQLNLLLNGFFLLATIVAALMIAQFLLGTSVQILPGRVESLLTKGTSFNEVTRILPPGWPIILVSFLALLCILVLKKPRSIKLLELLQCGLLGMAFIFTFLRSYWATLIIVLFFMLIIIRRKDRKRMIRFGVVVLLLFAFILIIVFREPDSRAASLVSASIDRLSTLTESSTFQGQDSSFNWRLLENKYAFSSIAKHPLIGIGMGARYRPFDRRLEVYSNTYDFRMHIHNGYIWILLDMGLLGFLVFMWLSIAFLIRGFRYWRSITSDRMRGVMLGFTLIYLVVMVAAVVNSTYTQWAWTPVIGIIMGVNEVILRENKNE